MSNNWETDPDRPKLHAKQFIERASGEDIDTQDFRRYISRRFIKISENVKCVHSRPCGYHIAEGILRVRHLPGAVVECGCFKGGMSAKMSVVCKAIGKKLMIFDSFCGLPNGEEFIGREGGKGMWEKGQWSSSLENTRNNIVSYGEISCCDMIEGYFKDTIHVCQKKIAFIFIDVDLPESARTCIRHFWPRLNNNRFYTHEITMQSYRKAMQDPEFWKEMNHPVPGIVGGFSDAPALGYLEKIS